MILTLRLLLLIAASIALYMGATTGEWRYSIATLSLCFLAMLGTLRSVRREHRRRKADITTILGAGVIASNSSSVDCGVDSGAS